MRDKQHFQREKRVKNISSFFLSLDADNISNFSKFSQVLQQFRLGNNKFWREKEMNQTEKKEGVLGLVFVAKCLEISFIKQHDIRDLGLQILTE